MPFGESSPLVSESLSKSSSISSSVSVSESSIFISASVEMSESSPLVSESMSESSSISSSVSVSVEYKGLELISKLYSTTNGAVIVSSPNGTAVKSIR